MILWEYTWETSSKRVYYRLVYIKYLISHLSFCEWDKIFFDITRIINLNRFWTFRSISADHHWDITLGGWWHYLPWQKERKQKFTIIRSPRNSSIEVTAYSFCANSKNWTPEGRFPCKVNQKRGVLHIITSISSFTLFTYHKNCNQLINMHHF